MSDRLENFVVANRDQFDNETPPAETWKELEKNLPLHKKQFRLFNLFSLPQLAAAVTLTAVGLAIFLVIENQKLKSDITASRDLMQSERSGLLENIHPEYSTEIDKYMRLVEIKQGELEIIKKDNPDLYNEFITQLHELDTEYEQLEQQLNKAPEQQELFEAMIQNLRLQTELLNEQLTIIKQIKNKKGKTQNTDRKI